MLNVNSLVMFGKLNYLKSLLAYGRSKLADILRAKELARKLNEEEVNIITKSFHRYESFASSPLLRCEGGRRYASRISFYLTK
ncbi:hypothetical protein Nepgr_022215 [Nepenthes gracilis]|uniref:Uncharacterized protein n=1 Tax=Nepenthes gracilis TaxID=150966 RepID=A0AAD3T0G6_NEPGR|nr:hypothetical protein Nepgr_022215 [Nepenthes gracilis]